MSLLSLPTRFAPRACCCATAPLVGASSSPAFPTRALATATPLATSSAMPATTSTSAAVPPPLPSKSHQDGSAPAVSLESGIHVLHTVDGVRQWRRRALRTGRSVGFVATMGALHAGHLSLVQRSLDENDETIVSVFVNPAQFAPHEDLAAYPRTLPADAQALSSLSSSAPLGTEEDPTPRTPASPRRVARIFAPGVKEMYPNGFTQTVADQVGAFVEVKGLSEQMEGASRPTFFRGVATVVTKLFHIVQPDHTYFGQKDIQQALILRRLVSDLRFSYPPSAEHLVIMPIARDLNTGLALSSRNAYLSPKVREHHATALYHALKAGQEVWNNIDDPSVRVVRTLEAAKSVLATETERAHREGVYLELDYLSLNDPTSFCEIRSQDASSRAIFSGAINIADALPGGQPAAKPTRLIDNVLLGFSV